ncbi:MAG: hypothetical protein MAG794_01492 [Gammaproteobacteria bacterium]|nr:hypothetical protein [Gammaproteobacteria bacterium]
MAPHGRRDRVHQGNGSQARQKCEALHGEHRQRKKNPESGAQTGSHRHTEYIGRNQWVAKQSLIGRTGSGQCGAHHQRRGDARQTNREQYGVHPAVDSM